MFINYKANLLLANVKYISQKFFRYLYGVISKNLFRKIKNIVHSLFDPPYIQFSAAKVLTFFPTKLNYFSSSVWFEISSFFLYNHQTTFFLIWFFYSRVISLFLLNALKFSLPFELKFLTFRLVALIFFLHGSWSG